MKKWNTFITLAIISAVALSGCGSQQDTTAAVEQNTTSAAQPKTATTTPNLKDGVADLLHVAKQIRKGVTQGDEGKIKENGPKLEEVWSSFEDGVKEKYPDSYKNVEKYLDPAIAASKSNPLDKETLSKINEQLIGELYNLSAKLIPVEEIKDGASKMLETTESLKQAIKAGDEAKVKELGPKLEETWGTFEDGVKPRLGDLYEKLEKPLNPEVAGSQVSPLDKELLGQLNDQLTQALNELVQKTK